MRRILLVVGLFVATVISAGMLPSATHAQSTNVDQAAIDYIIALGATEGITITEAELFEDLTPSSYSSLENGLSLAEGMKAQPHDIQAWWSWTGGCDFASYWAGNAPHFTVRFCADDCEWDPQFDPRGWYDVDEGHWRGYPTGDGQIGPDVWQLTKTWIVHHSRGSMNSANYRAWCEE